MCEWVRPAWPVVPSDTLAILAEPDEASAQVYADDLRSRWTLVSATRAVPSDDAPNMDASGSHVETGRSALMGAGHRVKL